MSADVILIRHGETIWQKDGRYQGKSDIPLSPDGRNKLSPAPFCPSHVYVSGLARTLQTAQILFPGSEYIQVPALGEMDFGVFEGKNYQELNGRTDYQSWVDSGCLRECPGGESKQAFSDRVCSAFEELMLQEGFGAGTASSGSANPGKAGFGETGACASGSCTPPLVLVAHAGTLMAILERFAVPARDYFDWHCSCGCGYELSARNWKTKKLQVIRTINCTHPQ